ncbi:FtsK/SpoIIIE domain-containing protein [Agromyces sp. ZXT2-6]|uniref:FtsK/SpoIIIE domain-containing protein n=1 Tax=Agromyces sp. ZXT2-6 TaxID=3461153 RepID=UPI004054F587
MPDTSSPVAPGLSPLALPPRAPEPARAGFPWIASSAPVAGALLIWAVTGSTFALLFAVLGPLVAVASMLDSRRQAVRERRRGAADRERALARLEDEIALRHDLEREAAWRDAPGARRIIEQHVPAWRERAPGRVVLGAAGVPSRVRVEGVPGDERDADLLRRAARLLDAPVTADVSDGLGFVGPRALALAAARAAVVQCAHAVAPDALAIDGPSSPEWRWLAALPHSAASAPARLLVTEGAGAPAAGGRARGARPHVIAVGTGTADLPPGLGTVVDLRHRGSAVVGGRPPVEIVPELMSSAEAGTWAERAAAVARRAGLGRTERLPIRVELTELGTVDADPSDRSSLRVPVGAGDGVPLALDLAAGPHALVAGTSGSGKSEFLVCWIASLAAAHAPDRVAFLLVDFKGGAAFDPVAALPHVTGVVTDLAEGEAGRAVASMRAELRHREQVLAAAGARDIARLPSEVVLPRLVVVVDEFQAMVERFPDLGAVIADVAARGRSLGVHLVLASQRPNGVVRESVTANCGIRVSLRVLQRADSVAVVGTDEAASLDVSTPGRAIADPGDGRTVRFQSAIADEAAIRRARERHAGAAPPRRPWLDPLPATLGLDSIAEVLGTAPAAPGRVLLGVADDPDRQRRVAIEWDPRDDGPLAVLGMPGSGRTALLDAIAAQVADARGVDAVVRVEGTRSGVWDALDRAESAIAGGPGVPHLIVFDDVDGKFSGWPDEARFAAIAKLETVLRGARGAGSAVVVSASRPAGLGSGVRDGLTSTVLLRHPSRADLVHAGGDGSLWDPDGPAGSGQWRGLRAQFLAAPRPATMPVRPPARFEPAQHPLTVICSATPRADAAALTTACPEADVVLLGAGGDATDRAATALRGGTGPARNRFVIGDAESWAANWSLAGQARGRAAIVVHGGNAEYRALIRDPGPPPLLDDHRGQCWVILPEQSPVRRTWITPDDGIRA